MAETPTPWLTVVGVVDDVKLGSPDGGAAEQFYQPVTPQVVSEGAFASPGELAPTSAYIVLHGDTPPDQMVNSLRAAVQSIDPQLPLIGVRTMEHVISDSEAPRLFNTVLISAFAMIALLLAVLGIYSVIAFSVALREQEFAAGDVIPSEAQLGAAFEVRRLTVRQALYELRVEGYVIREKGRGTFVGGSAVKQLNVI
jgi:hypothetical protein